MSLKKEPRLSLGITIAGGRDCRSRLPVYITSVQPVGCLHRDGTIKRGREHLVMCDFKRESVREALQHVFVMLLIVVRAATYLVSIKNTYFFSYI